MKLQLQNATKATKDKAKESLGLVSLYEKESKTLVNLRNKYKDVALAQGVGSKAAKKLEKDVVALDSKLKKIDSNVGQHQRSVGNYSKSWNGLNNSINQLSREAPAFAVSMNTGFLAISNNIPTLVDEINKLKVANKGLIAQGKPAKSVFKSLAGAILSWQTLISVGVTLLTLYGGKLIELIKKNLDLKSSFDALNKTQEKANELSSESVSKFKTLISIVNDSTKSELDRKAALEELKKEYPSFISSLEDEGENLTISTIAAGKYIESLKQRGVAMAALSLLQEKQVEIFKKEIELKKEDEKAVEESIKIQERMAKAVAGTGNAYAKVQAIQSEEANLLNGVNKAQESLNKTQKEYNELLELFKNNFTPDTFKEMADGINESTKDAEKSIDSVIKKMSMFSDASQREFISDFSELIFGKPEDLKSAADRNAEIVGASLKTMVDDEKAAQTAITENQKIQSQKRAEIRNASFEAVSMIGNQLFTNAQINRDNDLNAFIEGKQVELDAAGDNAQKRAAIEDQIRKKEKQANIKAAKEGKKQALFNIAIGTAQAVVNALASLPPPLSFVVAGTTAVLGAVQAGLVASQPLPAFEKGGVMEKTGLAQVSEAGREMIIDPKGKVTMTGNKGAELREIEGGSTILNNAITEGILSRGMINSNDVNNASSSNIQAILRSERDRTATVIARTMKNENDMLMDSIEKSFKSLPEIHQFNFQRGELNKSVTKGNTRRNGWESTNSY